MNAFQNIMTLDIWQSILWVLVHTLWQGLAAALMLWGLLKWIPVKRAQGRYWLSVLCLAAIVVAALATWTVRRLPDAYPMAAAPETTSDTGAHYAVTSQANPEQTEALSALMPPARKDPSHVGPACLVAFWGAGVLMMLLRVAFSLGAARGLLQGARVLDDPNLLQCIESLRRRLGLHRRFIIQGVDSLCVPAVVGVLRPTLLLPLALLNEMSPAQVEVIVAHELAHIHRSDMLFTLIQRVIEALLFFNPAVWWISRQVSLEREACCDAAAVAVTGPRETVARVLFDVVSRLHQPAPGLQAAVALHQPNRQGHFTERLRRLLEPTTQVPLRLPWPSFMMLLTLTGMGLLVLHWGTRHAVIKAAEWLSPKQHIEQIEQVKVAYAPPEDPLYEGTEGKFLVRGTVRTFDGSPLPDDLCIEFRGHYAGGGGIACYSADLEGNTFQYTIRQRRFSVIATSDTFAPLVVGPLKIEGDLAPDNIQLVLQPGFRAQVKLQDPSGHPIKGAEVDFIYHHDNSTFGGNSLVSDEDGRIIFNHAGKFPVSLSTRTPGFQFDTLKTQLSQEKGLDWTLIPAQPTTGTLVSRETGRPMAHVPVYLLSRQGFQDCVNDPRHAYNQARCHLTDTDAQGRFVLDSLRTDCIYALYINGTEQVGPDILPGIVAGQKDLRLEVSPARYVQGKILGPYEPERRRLSRQSPEAVPVLRYGNVLHFGNNSFSSGFHVPLYELDDQTGWSFKIPNLLPNDVTIALKGHESRTIPKVTQAIENYTIDLRPGAADPSVVEQETRTVVVKLIGPEGWPVPTGKIRVDHVMTDRNGYKPYWLDLEDGQVQLDVPMLAHGQGKFRYESSQDLIGYWIEEKSGIPIPPGEGPYVIEVQALPAGAVHGFVLGQDGKPMPGASVYMHTVERSPDIQKKRMDLDHSVHVGAEGRFVFSPVPLSGLYQLKAYRSQGNECFLVFSEALTVTREKPTQVVTLTIPAGKTIRGRIVNPNGQGLSQAKVALDYRHEHGSHGGASITADAEGYFEFTHVNTDANCAYAYRVSPTGNYCGREVPATLEDTQTIALQEGHTVRGRVIESKSGNLIPGAELSLYPNYGSDAQYKGDIKTQTNAMGEFVIRGLEPVEYRVWIEGAVHPDTKIRENPDGSISYQGSESIFINGEQSGPIDIRVQLKPGSRLQPLAGQ
jgi:beta-lactamase regulating signal transducer with metallopeptidase domain